MPHSRLLRGMPENQAGASLQLPISAYPARTPPDTSELFTTYNGRFVSLLQNNGAEDDDAEIVTASLNAGLVDGAIAFPLLCVARVRWGVGGANQEAFVTVRQGTMLTVCATAISVDMIALLSAGVIAPTGLPTGRVALAYGSRPSGSGPTFDIYRPTTAAGTEVITVPPFAQRMSLMASDPGMLGLGGGVKITVDMGNSVTMVIGSLGADLTQGFPLPFSPVSVALQNLSGIAGTWYVVFDLGL